MSRLLHASIALALFASTISMVSSCGSNSSSSGGPSVQPAYVAVADSGNNRILIYPAPLTTNESATIVIGQMDLFQGSPNQGAANPSAASLSIPEGLAMDPSGNLWVADSSNCRVLEFRPPFTTGMFASVVLGQQNFQTTETIAPVGICNGGASSAPSGMEWPFSVAIDSKGDVWVVDMAAGRITEYTPPFTNGMAASLVIGQASLNNTSQCNGVSNWPPPPALPPAPTLATLCDPAAAAFDPDGDLWVADSSNNRVLEFVPPFTTGMAASRVIGDSPVVYEDGCANPAGPSPNITASTFCGPQDLAFDSKGDLWVSDDGYNRVLEFVPPFSNGMSASLVIGASTFTQPPQYQEIPAAADLLNNPYGIAFDSNGNLLLSDGGNSRVLTFVPPFSNGMSATFVTGEPDMLSTSRTSGCRPPSANTLCWSEGGVLTF